MLNNWATTKAKYRSGLFHDKYIGLRIPSYIYLQLKNEANRRNLKLSTFVKLLIEKAIQNLENEKN
jgi:predicted DNA-binding protein